MSMKKKFFVGVLVVGFFIALVHVIHMLTLDRMVQYREIDFFSANWPAELNGYRIGFIADTHRLYADDLETIVAELNDRNLDLLLLGGDYAYIRNIFGGRGLSYFYASQAEYVSSVFTAFASVNTTDGIFGVEGNHDIHFPVGEIMAQAGIGFLQNSGLHIRDGFFLAGVDDLWHRSPCIETATSDAAQDDFVLLLTHHPDVAMKQDTSGVDLILAGHTHGGQITFFGWPFYLLRGSITDYGTRFGYGWAESRHGVPVYVTRGLGNYSVPRVFARRQVVVFTMWTR